MNDQATEPPATGELTDEAAQNGSATPEPRFRRFDCTDPSDRAAVTAAATAARRAIEAGDCVVLPTDTVYGIGADAYSAEAVQRLLDAKGRGRDMPPPVLIADPSVLKGLTEDVPEAAEELVKALWPGALTIICTAKSSLRMDLGETAGTVAVRVPDHDLTRALLRQTGPMAVSSANRTGHRAALTCDEAIDQLGDAVAVYLDGGAVGGADGKPSTMIDFTVKPTGQILRRGALSLETLREYLPDLEDLTSDEPERPTYTVADLRARHTLQPPESSTGPGTSG
ncbi:L-threonylcarbamoyladenylate synthase [Microlunatus soli]|uniref:L-threonylcarbamoyladenylate synthase n=1 Tax=Microlunatus soli TaxID=630515 RepID=A0A1H1ZUW0_9ACTN|nr:L-threonylcarbamoyladenylate synthase [Microlunatus soli]SDT37514.1 tRNA threonylcarbamoyl adenosine modification protein, Sua5/YciO/YrdC/YwlC family [Microlunatus soli]